VETAGFVQGKPGVIEYASGSTTSAPTNMPRRTVSDWLVHTRVHFGDVGTRSAWLGTHVSAAVRCSDDVPTLMVVVGLVCAVPHAVTINVTATQASNRDGRTGTILP
jgi:hypothetical protein